MSRPLFPCGENRSCWRCGCAQEECECKSREATALTTLPGCDRLLEELSTKERLDEIIDL